MNRFFPQRIVWLAWLCLALIGMSCRSTPPTPPPAPTLTPLPTPTLPPPVSETVEHGLTIRLSTDQAVYTVGQPVTVTVSVHNDTSSSIMIYDALDLDCCVGIAISFEQQPYESYQGPFPVASIYVEPKPLSPGAQRSFSFSVWYNIPSYSAHYGRTHFYAFPKPGHYALRATLIAIVPDQRVYSAPLSIHMIAPQGNDATVWRLLQTEDAARFLHESVILLPPAYLANSARVMADFRAIVANYPTSFYTPYLCTAMAAYQTAQGQVNATAQTACAEAATSLVSINGQLYLVRPQTADLAVDTGSVTATAQQEDLEHVVMLVQEWVDAWNTRDIERYAQLYSYRTFFRQDWEAGEGNRSYIRSRKRVEALFIENGALTVEIVGFTIGTDEITADVVSRFERTKADYTFSTMHFVLDEDRVWRLDAPGF